MICEMCRKAIIGNGGYFSTFINHDRKDFHINCRPVLFYQDGKSKAMQYTPFKESKHEEKKF